VHFLDRRIASIGTMKVGGLSGIIGNSLEPWVREESRFAAVMGTLANGTPVLNVEGRVVVLRSRDKWV
jgi:hypothetical protein